MPVLMAVVSAAAWAQSGADAVSLEALLPELEGLERARALARLTEIYGEEAADKAIAYGEEALEILADFPDHVAEVTIQKQLAWAYMVQGDRARAGALAAEGGLEDLSDGSFDEDRARRVEILESRYQSERREREIEALRTQQTIQDLDLERQRYQRNGVIAGAAVLAMLGFGLYRRHRVLSRLYAELGSANERLEELSITDALTGLHNRRYLTQSMEADVAASLRAHRSAAKRGESPQEGDLVFFLLDIDLFKTVNDEHGHAAGDAVLREFGDLLRQVCRGADTLVRWGGEEFLVVSRTADRSESGGFAERLRREVAQYRFDAGNGATVRRTCSIGFAAYPFVPAAPEAVGWEQVTALADDALYIAKRSGRDAWVGLRSTESTPVERLASHAGVDVEEWVAAGWLAQDTSAS